MRLALFLLVFILSMFGVTKYAAADHLVIDGPGRITFGCESADNMIKLVKAKDDTETSAILAGAHCFRFSGAPSVTKAFIGTYRDPMAGNLYEVYEVELPDGKAIYTYLDAPSEQS